MFYMALSWKFGLFNLAFVVDVYEIYDLQFESFPDGHLKQIQ